MKGETHNVRNSIEAMRILHCKNAEHIVKTPDINTEKRSSILGFKYFKLSSIHRYLLTSQPYRG